MILHWELAEVQNGNSGTQSRLRNGVSGFVSSRFRACLTQTVLCSSKSESWQPEATPPRFSSRGPYLHTSIFESLLVDGFRSRFHTLGVVPAARSVHGVPPTWIGSSDSDLCSSHPMRRDLPFPKQGSMFSKGCCTGWMGETWWTRARMPTTDHVTR